MHIKFYALIILLYKNVQTPQDLNHGAYTVYTGKYRYWIGSIYKNEFSL